MRMSMLTLIALTVALTLLASSAGAAASPQAVSYVDIVLTGGHREGRLLDKWDLTACDLTLSFAYDGSGLVDDYGEDAHALARLGMLPYRSSEFGPTAQAVSEGVWLATDYDWAVNTFFPDPPGAPALDMDDKLLLQTAGGRGEGSYNLPASPPDPAANHRFWFDRDGVDEWEAQNPLAVDGGTYNTRGLYYVVMTLHAVDATTGTAYMTVNGLHQGFETNGDWRTMELSPAGITFGGDMSQMQVFYLLDGYGATHRVAFRGVTVTGCPRREVKVFLPQIHR